MKTLYTVGRFLGSAIKWTILSSIALIIFTYAVVHVYVWALVINFTN